MARPNRKPRKQKTSPTSSRLWPFIPKNDTWERSGMTSLASPPGSCWATGACCASTTPENMNIQTRTVAIANEARRHRRADWKPAASLECITIPPKGAQQDLVGTSDSPGETSMACRPEIALPHQENGVEVWPRPRLRPPHTGRVEQSFITRWKSKGQTAAEPSTESLQVS